MVNMDEILPPIVHQIRHASMVPDDNLVFSWRTALELIEADVPGAFLECGTWLGGSSFGLALAQRRAFGRVIRPIYMLDSFEGLPPATRRDGPAALEYQRLTNHPGYYDNCRAPLEKVLQIREGLGLSDDECPLVPGWFHETLPLLSPKWEKSGIAWLRVDCDWYDPVRLILDVLEPILVEEGIMIIDDYYAWDGCARAVHDYLSANDLAYRLREGGSEGWLWFRKRSARVL